MQVIRTDDKPGVVTQALISTFLNDMLNRRKIAEQEKQFGSLVDTYNVIEKAKNEQEKGRIDEAGLKEAQTVGIQNPVLTTNDGTIEDSSLYTTPIKPPAIGNKLVQLTTEDQKNVFANDIASAFSNSPVAVKTEAPDANANAVQNKYANANNQYRADRTNITLMPTKFNEGDTLSLARAAVKAGMSPESALKYASQLASGYNARQDAAKNVALTNAFMDEYSKGGYEYYTPQQRAIIELAARTGNIAQLVEAYKAGGVPKIGYRATNTGGQTYETIFDERNPGYNKRNVITNTPSPNTILEEQTKIKLGEMKGSRSANGGTGGTGSSKTAKPLNTATAYKSMEKWVEVSNYIANSPTKQEYIRRLNEQEILLKALENDGVDVKNAMRYWNDKWGLPNDDEEE